MITKEEFYNWLDAEDFYNKEIENGVKFGADNPWDLRSYLRIRCLVEHTVSTGSIKLIDGVLHVNFADGSDDETFSSIREFAERWNYVMRG